MRLTIILLKPPGGTEYGLQKSSGSRYETVQKQMYVSGDLHFEFTVMAKRNKKLPEPDFSGPFVQGRAGERFVYIDIGACAGQTDAAWSRRLKVPLRDIPFSLIDQLISDPALHLETRVAGTGRDKGPNCGTVKPFYGWYVSNAKTR